jgi:hypothetical protein
MVGVAQLVEHLVVVQVVAGSSPVTHPKSKAICVRGKRGPGRLRHLCAVASLRASGGSATRTPLRLRFARLLGLLAAVG